jgi:hypothetical protein
MRLPIPKPLFDGHPLGVKSDNLLGRERKIPGDQKVPGFLISLSPKDDEIQGFLLAAVVEHLITPHLTRFDRKSSQEARFSLIIDDDLGFGPNQKGNPFPPKLFQKRDSGITAIHDEEGTTLLGKTTHDGQDQSVLQDVLALSDPGMGKAGKSHRKHPPFKDRPDQ